MKEFLVVILVGLILLMGCGPSIQPIHPSSETDLTFKGESPKVALTMWIGEELMIALRHSEVKALFTDLPVKLNLGDEVTCSDYHKLTEMLRSLDYSEDFIRRVFDKSVI